MVQLFDTISDTYDRWYDTPEGHAIFKAEIDCLRKLCGKCQDRWLEIGVGTGRFASMLGIAEGIDPSPHMLKIATERGIKTYEGCAENIPFSNDSFNGVLFALTFCFLADISKALIESHRVLKTNGECLLGIIPANSSWGREYERKKTDGHPIYSHAHFRTAAEVISLVEHEGFDFQKAASTLFWEPTSQPEVEPRVEMGIVSDAGFLALLFRKRNICDTKVQGNI